MESLQTLVDVFLQSHENWKFQLITGWASIVGDMQQHISLEKITDDSTLIIGVHDTRWMQELYYLSHELVDLINRGLKGPFVKSVRFILSRRLHIAPKNRRKILKQAYVTKKIPPARRSLTDRQRKALECITDNELQNALRDLMQMSS